MNKGEAGSDFVSGRRLDYGRKCQKFIEWQVELFSGNYLEALQN